MNKYKKLEQLYFVDTVPQVKKQFIVCKSMHEYTVMLVGTQNNYSIFVVLVFVEINLIGEHIIIIRLGE